MTKADFKTALCDLVDNVLGDVADNVELAEEQESQLTYIFGDIAVDILGNEDVDAEESEADAEGK